MIKKTIKCWASLFYLQISLTCFLLWDDEMEDATVLDLDLLGVIPTFSPRKIELTTKEQISNDMSNMLFFQL